MKAGKATEAVIDFSDLGGILMISRLISPRRTRSSWCANRLQMPAPDKGLARRQGHEDFFDKTRKVTPQQSLKQAPVKSHRILPFCDFLVGMASSGSLCEMAMSAQVDLGVYQNQSARYRMSSKSTSPIKMLRLSVAFGTDPSYAPVR